MRSLSVLTATCATLASAQTPIVAPKTKKHNTEGGIGKVVSLLKDMQKTISEDMEQDAGIYDKFACYCKEEKADVGKRIEDNKSLLVKLTKSINLASSLITEAELQIKFETANVAREKKKQDNISTMLGKEEEAFEKRRGEHTETLNVLSRAVTALTKKRSFLEMDSDVKKQLALVETLTGKSVGEGTMGAATGYLVELKKQTAADLQQQTKDILNSRKNYNLEMLISMQAVAQHEEIKSTQEGILAKNMEKKGEDVKAYAAAKAAMDADVKFFDSLSADCEKRSNFYAGQVRDAQAENDAINAALPILQAIVDGKNTSFVQLATSAKMSLESRVDATSRAIAKLSISYKMKLKSMLAATTSTSSIDKLVNTCEGMITTLKTEIGEVEQSKATCISETQRLEMERLDAEKEKNTASNKLAGTIAALEHKEFEIEDNEGKINRNTDKTTDLVAQCKATALTLTNQVAELTAELKAIDQAITAISAAYGDDAVSDQSDSARYNDAHISRKEGQPDTDFSDTKARRAGGSSIVTMLEMIRGQVAKNLADSGTENTDTEEACTKEKAELAAIDTALNAEKVALSGAKVALEGDKSNDEISLGEKETAEGNAESAQEGYGNCAQKIPEYNNAIAAKYADIDGLTLVIGHLGNIDNDYAGKAGV